MPILIDGWNFIRDDRSDIRDDETSSLEAAEHLLRYMEEYQRTHNDPVILVFDSRREFLDIPYKNNKKLTVVPAKNADDYIKKRITETPERQRRNLRVVSSDSSIYYYARDSYATALRSEEFWKKVRGK